MSAVDPKVVNAAEQEYWEHTLPVRVWGRSWGEVCSACGVLLRRSRLCGSGPRFIGQ